MSTSSTNTLGKYQIIREIARSNDIVYEAVDPGINRRVALKELCIPPNLQGAQRRERIERFWREGKAAGKLTHPNIVTIYEVGKDGDRHFIAMEFLEGRTLREMIQASGPLPLKDVTNYTLQLCSALAYAHQHGVIHRDIKPENVQILPGGIVKLTDFGIARLMGEPSITQDGQVFGTPSYMSPEQVAGKDLDNRSDVFSLGVILYEMITGHKPFTGDSIVTITYNIMNLEPQPPPGAPPYIAGIIRKAMSKDKDMRYASAEEMAEDLRDEKCSGGVGFDLAGTGSWPSPIGGSSQPSPFGGAQQPASPFAPAPSQSPFSVPPAVGSRQGALTPYGTPTPSADPFAPAPAPAQAPRFSPPRPVISAETKNFLGILLLSISLAGMLVFAIWAVNRAYMGFAGAKNNQIAGEYLAQGNKLKASGNIDGAIEQWQQAVRVGPNSPNGKIAREAVFDARVARADETANQPDSTDLLEQQARDLIQMKPHSPEGYFYLGYAYQLEGESSKAVTQYDLAAKYGGNDKYAIAARANCDALTSSSSSMPNLPDVQPAPFDTQSQGATGNDTPNATPSQPDTSSPIPYQQAP